MEEFLLLRGGGDPDGTFPQSANFNLKSARKTILALSDQRMIVPLMRKVVKIKCGIGPFAWRQAKSRICL